MAYEQRNGDLAIFKVKEKKSDKGPDWTGKALIDGVEKDVSLWIKSDTMLTGQIKDKWKPSQHDKDKQNAYVKDHQAPLDMDDSEIPF